MQPFGKLRTGPSTGPGQALKSYRPIKVIVALALATPVLN
jgi:hypothetical protein